MTYPAADEDTIWLRVHQTQKEAWQAFTQDDARARAVKLRSWGRRHHQLPPPSVPVNEPRSTPTPPPSIYSGPRSPTPSDTPSNGSETKGDADTQCSDGSTRSTGCNFQINVSRTALAYGINWATVPNHAGDTVTLTRTDWRRIQDNLKALGYPAGKSDGIPGA